jgi:hypothetical protein
MQLQSWDNEAVFLFSFGSNNKTIHYGNDNEGKVEAKSFV